MVFILRTVIETSALDPETATAGFCRHLFVVGSRHSLDRLIALSPVFGAVAVSAPGGDVALGTTDGDGAD